jgi:hypothetical protein
LNGRPDDLGIRGERLLPEAVTQHDFRAGIEQPAGGRPHSQHLEIVVRNQVGPQALAGGGEDERTTNVRRQPRERCGSVAIVEIIRIAEDVIGIVQLQALERDQLARLLHARQRAQQQGIDYGIDGRVCANGESQGEHGGGREFRIAVQRSSRVSNHGG